MKNLLVKINKKIIFLVGLSELQPHPPTAWLMRPCIW